MKKGGTLLYSQEGGRTNSLVFTVCIWEMSGNVNLFSVTVCNSFFSQTLTWMMVSGLNGLEGCRRPSNSSLARTTSATKTINFQLFLIFFMFKLAETCLVLKQTHLQQNEIEFEILDEPLSLKSGNF